LVAAAARLLRRRLANREDATLSGRPLTLRQILSLQGVYTALPERYPPAGSAPVIQATDAPRGEPPPPRDRVHQCPAAVVGALPCQWFRRERRSPENRYRRSSRPHLNTAPPSEGDTVPKPAA